MFRSGLNRLQERVSRAACGKRYPLEHGTLLIEQVHARKRRHASIAKLAACRGRGGYPALVAERLIDEEVRVRSPDNDANELLRGFDDFRVIQCGRECTTLEAGRRSSCLRAGKSHHHLLLLRARHLKCPWKLREARELPIELGL